MRSFDKDVFGSLFFRRGCDVLFIANKRPPVHFRKARSRQVESSVKRLTGPRMLFISWLFDKHLLNSTVSAFEGGPW